VIEEIQGPLQEICGRLDGALAATVMGFDGLPVDAYHHQEAGEDLDISSLLVEFSSLLGQVKASAQMFAAGGLEELSVRSERLTTLIRPLGDEYFLALALRPDANTGKGRYLLRIHAPGLTRFLT
jgi:predicted regulator of Ras-like GTPase activity (Roadblock/LC7/MglB family)